MPSIWIANKWKFIIQMFLLFICSFFRSQCTFVCELWLKTLLQITLFKNKNKCYLPLPKVEHFLLSIEGFQLLRLFVHISHLKFDAEGLHRQIQVPIVNMINMNYFKITQILFILSQNRFKCLIFKILYVLTHEKRINAILFPNVK